MYKFLATSLLFLLLPVFSLPAQNKDSLWRVYTNAKLADTTRSKALGKLAHTYLRINPDSAILLLRKQVSFSHKAKLPNLESTGLNNIGLAFFNKGDYPNALKYHLKTLRIREKLGDKKGIGVCKLNIGNIYLYQRDYDKALQHYELALKLARETNDVRHEGYAYDNIAVAYANKGDLKKALEYFELELNHYKKHNDNLGQANCLGNIGAIYTMQEDFSNALEKHRESMSIRKKINDLHGIGICYINLAGNATKTGNYNLSIIYLDSCVKLSKSTQDMNNLKTAYEAMSGAYKRMGKWEKAYESLYSFTVLTDSMFNVENSKQIGDLKTNFEVEKNAAKLKAKQDKKDAIAAADAARQRIILFAVAGIALLVLVFAVFISRNLRVTRKQKNIIQQQKHIVEEKHKEITDSINYAERIQRSLLASKQLLDNNLHEHFVMFKPKDVVSGDFYWAAESSGLFYLACADSTGHGVPGAIMSILNIACLEKAVEAEKLQSPSKILDFTRSKIIEILKKDGSLEGGRDGMDASLLCFNFKKNTLTVASANNIVWLVRGTETIEIKPDKMPVGKHDKQDIAFTQQEIDLQKGDMIYAFTDGYIDQFGGEQSKKFMSKNFREMLVAHANLSMPAQKQQLETTFTQWMGSLEQTDDVCVIGVRI